MYHLSAQEVNDQSQEPANNDVNVYEPAQARRTQRGGANVDF